MEVITQREVPLTDLMTPVNPETVTMVEKAGENNEIVYVVPESDIFNISLSLCPKF